MHNDLRVLEQRDVPGASWPEGEVAGRLDLAGGGIQSGGVGGGVEGNSGVVVAGPGGVVSVRAIGGRGGGVYSDRLIHPRRLAEVCEVVLTLQLVAPRAVEIWWKKTSSGTLYYSMH